MIITANLYIRRVILESSKSSRGVTIHDHTGTWSKVKDLIGLFGLSTTENYADLKWRELRSTTNGDAVKMSGREHESELATATYIVIVVYIELEEHHGFFPMTIRISLRSLFRNS